MKGSDFTRRHVVDVSEMLALVADLNEGLRFYSAPFSAQPEP